MKSNMQYPCFNKKCHHNDNSDSGCDCRSRFSVDMCISFYSDNTSEKIKELEELVYILYVNCLKIPEKYIPLIDDIVDKLEGE